MTSLFTLKAHIDLLELEYKKYEEAVLGYWVSKNDEEVTKYVRKCLDIRAYIDRIQSTCVEMTMMEKRLKKCE